MGVHWLDLVAASVAAATTWAARSWCAALVRALSAFAARATHLSAVCDRRSTDRSRPPPWILGQTMVEGVSTIIAWKASEGTVLSLFYATSSYA